MSSHNHDTPEVLFARLPNQKHSNKIRNSKINGFESQYETHSNKNT